MTPARDPRETAAELRVRIRESSGARPELAARLSDHLAAHKLPGSGAAALDALVSGLVADEATLATLRQRAHYHLTALAVAADEKARGIERRRDNARRANGHYGRNDASTVATIDRHRARAAELRAARAELDYLPERAS